MAKQRNWEKIKAEYITGNLSLRKTAEKFGVPFQALPGEQTVNTGM